MTREEANRKGRERYARKRSQYIASRARRSAAMNEKRRAQYAMDPAMRERVRERGRTRHKTPAVQQKKRTRARERRLLALSILGGKCFQCEEARPAALEIDHIVPIYRRTSGISRSESNSPRNVVALGSRARETFQLLCGSCHRIKSNLELERGEWRKGAMEPEPESGQVEMFTQEQLG